MVALDYSYKVIKRECIKYGLPTYSCKISQSICLNTISKALNNLQYKEEWKSWKFVNSITGHRFLFDGYFQDIGLIVEFHGYQHYVFPSVYIKYERDYLAQRERDRIKKEMIDNDPTLKYFLITEEEPFDDVMYITGKLKGAGII